MKNILFIFAVSVVVLTASCSNKNNAEKTLTPYPAGQEAVAQPVNHPATFLSKVDTDKIKTFDDYYRFKNKLFEEYYQLKQKSFNEYYQAKNAAFADYFQKSRPALLAIRETSKEKYLEWLDAEKIGDYQRQEKIEASPEFAGYDAVQKNEYAKYQAVEKEKYTLYQKTEKGGYEEYQTKEQLCYTAYLRNKN